MSTPSRNLRRALVVRDVLTVLVLVALCASAILPEAEERLTRGRDARRLEDLARVRDALEQYHLDTGRFPPAQATPESGGWDVSHDGAFVPELVRAGYLREMVGDPLEDAQHHYRYRVHTPGSFGCASEGEWYVLGLRAFESEYYARRRPGGFDCGRVDWSGELAWVTGGGTVPGVDPAPLR